jgi:hypothetical protein
MIEPKIGVPFEYEGKWYVARQIGKLDHRCSQCAFDDHQIFGANATACHAMRCRAIQGAEADMIIKRYRWLSRLYDWFWSDDPIAQRFRIGYAAVVILGLAGCVFGLGLLAGRGGM